MKTLEIVGEADADNVVRIAIPVDDSARRYRLIVLIEPEANSRGNGAELEEWPAGFFDRTFGAWTGDLERPPQGEYEKREPF